MRSSVNCLFLRRLGFTEIDIAHPAPGVRSDIVQEVARRHGLTAPDLQGPLPRSMVPIRDEAIWRLRQSRGSEGGCPNSYPRLAAYFGLQDHTTIMAAERRHRARLAAA